MGRFSAMNLSVGVLIAEPSSVELAKMRAALEAALNPSREVKS